MASTTRALGRGARGMARSARPFLLSMAILASSAWAFPGSRAEGNGPDFSENLTGDWGGQRSALAARGLELRLDYTGEVLGNLDGGVRRGAIYEGAVRLGVTLDLERAMGWTGGKLQADALQTHGQGLSEHYLGNLLTVSSIEAAPSTRLYTAWFEQSLFSDFASLRIGQLLADEEFLVSEQAGLFVNATFGWPAIAGAGLRGGGPAYPLATPGIRIRLGAPEATYLAFGAFNGDPAGGRSGDPQRRNRNGLLFPVGDDAFLIGEVGHGVERGITGLPATLKFGGWYHTGRYQDLGAALEGEPSMRRGNYGLYALADAQLWRPQGQEDGGIGAFFRVVGTPARLNPIDLYLDAGLTYKGPLPGRPEDVLGLGVAYAQVSGAARRRDREARLLDDLGGALRRQEALVELTYAAQLQPGWLLQPVAQYVVHPGAEAGIRNALVLGMRTALSF
ncbi:carbohydrate porin [Roseomonas sp. SSH11]|uniref:Carbohydrate porin n=1 Tax=Pararoseomonas baculiformis TaxID=2820812 RepID=A0ABS4ABM1_9PROT|nr:carbohydrate porin [Pararoseomonas baculiformis]MBP0444266.1 carbohydrate porin [Pararoseomonas baculiformis]